MVTKRHSFTRRKGFRLNSLPVPQDITIRFPQRVLNGRTFHEQHKTQLTLPIPKVFLGALSQRRCQPVCTALLRVWSVWLSRTAMKIPQRCRSISSFHKTTSNPAPAISSILVRTQYSGKRAFLLVRPPSLHLGLATLWQILLL